MPRLRGCHPTLLWLLSPQINFGHLWNSYKWKHVVSALLCLVFLISVTFEIHLFWVSCWLFFIAVSYSIAWISCNLHIHPVSVVYVCLWFWTLTNAAVGNILVHVFCVFVHASLLRIYLGVDCWSLCLRSAFLNFAKWIFILALAICGNS